MKETQGNPVYRIGDVVRVVDKPYDQCSFGWMPSMDRFCGVTKTIRGICWVEALGIYGYRIDGTIYTFCKNCFVPLTNEDDADYDSADTTS